MANMHRAGRIGGHILDIHSPPRASVAVAVGFARRENLAEPLMPEPIGEAQIDEAWPRHLRRRISGFVPEARGKLVGEGARRHPGWFRQDHRRVGRDIAMRRIARRLDCNAGEIETSGQFAVRRQRLDLGNDKRVEMSEKVFHVAAYLSKTR